MTGLDVEKERIIEVGAIVTDLKWQEIESYHAIVKQPQAFLDQMDDWNTQQHGKTGLTELVPDGTEPDLVEAKLCELIDRHFAPDQEKPILCGNSIFQDRRFIDRYFENLSNKLHYRMIDVTSWKLLMTPLFNIEYKKKDSHRALEDIRESIAELRTFIEFVQNK